MDEIVRQAALPRDVLSDDGGVRTVVCCDPETGMVNIHQHWSEEGEDEEICLTADDVQALMQVLVRRFMPTGETAHA